VSDRALEHGELIPDTSAGAPPSAGPLAILERIRRPRPLARPGERCELCAADISDAHSHVVNLDSRGLLCVCRACYLLFTQRGAAGGRYQAVPDRVLCVADFSLTASEWEALQIPVAVAFFFYNSDLERIAAFYPSPAGATECLLPLGAWEGVVAANRALASIEPDVEAVLIRLGNETSECYLVPIDACYELVGLLRQLWRGFDGGREVHDALAGFFDKISGRARPARSQAGSVRAAVPPAPVTVEDTGA
jgi:hypothetical protein